jgi:hypothetical protein
MGLLVFGFMLGMFSSLASLFILGWFLLRRGNREVFGRFLQGVAALVTSPDKGPEKSAGRNTP